MAAIPQQPVVLSFEEAPHTVQQRAAQVSPRGTETVDLLAARGRVLAEPVVADRDFPPFRRAMRDGYAVHSADLAQLPATLEVIGELKAGATDMSAEVRLGQAASIMTGAPAPAGADAVVMVEYTSVSGNRVVVTRGVRAGDNIVPAGSEARKGQVLLEPGTRLGYSETAAVASVGKTDVAVFRRPVVAILSTGDEVVEISEQPGPSQIRTSNSYSLAVQVQQAGGEPQLVGIARDEMSNLRTLIAKGLHSDLLLLTGGVSMGKYDLVEQVLEEFGAEFLFTGAQIQPGKPIVFGEARGKYFFGLPGNPVSTMVTLKLFAKPMLQALAGVRPAPLIFLHGRLKAEIKTKTGLQR